MTARPTLARRALAEFLGTGLLVTTVVGSGIAAQRLSTDVGLRLLENSIATVFGLAVLILLLGPVSGAHFNPVVSATDALLGRRTGTGLPARDLVVYMAAQVLGGIGGAVLANLMFQVPTAIATTERATAATLLGEVVATAGLVLLITGLTRTGQALPVIAAAVGAYIGAAYWFTSSTSFANPAVTIGRVFTDTFAGIAPVSVLPFLAAQLVGGAVGIGLTVLLFATPAPVDSRSAVDLSKESLA
ncbi:Glycerol uptake facilitator (Major Intrinsic Protein Family) [Microbacterium azadirachtae]|uniref:Glycerol uptake facilitator (Major Intrinsic Protein Family) n=1 Tax=Microbacterium azadirachtae TaxID=582680 RepID=A0A1I6FXN1_9MICO|nr:MIP/aquaporin family protein [Microbacterium azadirachtae]SFR34587.1 Glycerol uptake facilitator (Major Intrinsic Protein Family) [Microbacterium azadirachtae]